MLDAIAKEAAVFEPKEVEVLTAAYGMAARKCGMTDDADDDKRNKLAILVHNLGRSRLKLGKGLRTPSDAERLAEEAVDLIGYLRQTPGVEVGESCAKRHIDRDLTIFPADLRQPPTSAFRKI